VQLAVARQLRGTGVTPASVADLPPLPEAEAELRTIARALDPRSALLLTGSQATEAMVERAPLNSYDILVFATHGLVSGDLRGLGEPALVLTPPRGGDAAGQRDGLLTASEIALLDLNADWVILSACNTAAGEGGNAPTFSGLARAFVQAGARSLLLSQWPLEDRTASTLTIDTVRNVAGGMNKSAALQSAQLAMVGRGGPAAHPAFWAGFMLVGR
jgi:CHAT domain-containing protein